MIVTDFAEIKKMVREEFPDFTDEEVKAEAKDIRAANLEKKREVKPKRTEKFEDVIGLEDVKLSFVKRCRVFEENKERLAEMNATPPKGLLIYGPPGVGKSYIMSAARNEFPDVQFIIVGLEDISSKNVGEGSSKIKEMFKKIDKTGKLTVLLLDEVDTILPSRAKTSSVLTSERVSEFMRILSGLEDSNNVYIVGTTNRPKNIDPAFKRSGRFEDRIRVDFPTFEERVDLAEKYLSCLPIVCDGEVDIPTIVAKYTEGVTGADFKAINSNIAAQIIMNGDKPLPLEEFVSAIQYNTKKRGMSIDQEKIYTAEYDEFEDEFESH